MKKPCCKKGFTLIELLIVIAIIGILAVALLPTIFGAPSKGRDAARIADLQRMEKVLMNGTLNGLAYPSSTTTPSVPAAGSCAETALSNIAYVSELSGKVPTDPQGLNGAVIASTACSTAGSYVYKPDPNGTSTPSKTYSFGLYARVENCTDKVVSCVDALVGKITPQSLDSNGKCTSTTSADWCYAVLVK